MLILWWVALLWGPDSFPGWSGVYYWLMAAVALLYLFSVIAHEMVHAVVARTGTRNLSLYPFGSALPFRLQQLDPGRGQLAAIAGLVFNLVLGLLLLLASALINQTTGMQGGLKATFWALGFLNVAPGVVNIIPGIPFDGGWVLSAASTWFSGDRESGLARARAIGQVASLILVLAGLFRGLTSDAWLQALGLVLIGWAAREAGAMGRQRGLLRGAFAQLSARDFMDSARAGDIVQADATVAEMVKAHPHYPPDLPLPVLDAAHKLVGITTLAAADQLLQGTWPTTPVRTLVTPISQVRAVSPDAPLTEALDLVQQRQGTPDSETPIPVVEDGRLVGSINLARLSAFENIGQAFGMEEASKTAASPQGFFRSLGALLPAIIIVALMAILGNLALHTDPVKLKNAGAGVGEQISFSNLVPTKGSIVGTDQANQVSAQVVAASPITTVTLKLDGNPLEGKLSGASPLTQTITASLGGLPQGIHTVSIKAETEAGTSDTAQWQFRVSTRGGGGGTSAGGSSPIPRTLEIVRYIPELDAHILADSTNVPLGVRITSQQPPGSARMVFDGQELEAKIAPVEGLDNYYSIKASARLVGAGSHQVRVDMDSGEGGVYSSQWVFSALKPDANNAYFKETDHFVAQPFLKYWQDNGGLAIFGYPISDRIQEKAQGTDEAYTAQYFERARFELHPATADQVILGRLSALLQKAEPPAAPIPGAQFFKETGHNVSGPFLDFWNSNGGLALFGYPITEELTEKNPLDGKEYKVQYFERNRFELHPDKAGTPFEVQLGQLGTQLYNQRYGPPISD